VSRFCRDPGRLDMGEISEGIEGKPVVTILLVVGRVPAGFSGSGRENHCPKVGVAQYNTGLCQKTEWQ